MHRDSSGDELVLDRYGASYEDFAFCHPAIPANSRRSRAVSAKARMALVLSSSITSVVDAPLGELLFAAGTATGPLRAHVI